MSPKLAEVLKKYGVSSADDAQKLDSLTKVEIILDLEDAFGVRIPEDADEWTMQQLVEFIERNV